jgi:hypothetical protein
MNGNVAARGTTKSPFSSVEAGGAVRWRVFLPLGILVRGLVAFFPARGECRPFLFFTPSFSTAELYDDNVFRKPNAKGDAISRFSPGFDASYMSLPFTLEGGYHFDSEIFANQTQLNRALARQTATLGGSYLVNRALTFAVDLAYLQSHRPEEHHAAVGTLSGRSSARSFIATPAAYYRFTPTLTGDTNYSFARNERGDVTTNVHRTHSALHWRLTPRDTLSFGYAFRQYLSSGREQGGVNGSGRRDTSSHVPTVEWRRRLFPRTSFALEGGPRFSNGGVSPEVRASIEQLFRKGKVSLTYGRSQHTVAGKTGAVDIEYVTLDGSYQLQRYLSFDAAFAFGDNSPQTGGGTKVYNARLQLTYLLNRYFTLRASYTFRLQNRDILSVTSGDILSDIFMLSLTFAAPTPMALP